MTHRTKRLILNVVALIVFAAGPVVLGVGACAGAMGCCACPPPAVSFTDDSAPTDAVEVAKGDACQRAYLRIGPDGLRCPEAKPDFPKLCRQLVAAGQPICPEKIAKVTSCAAIDKVCR